MHVVLAISGRALWKVLVGNHAVVLARPNFGEVSFPE